MVIDRTQTKAYPFNGKFIGYNEELGIDVTVLETMCDIQRTTFTDSNGFLKASYTIYFPFDRIGGISVRRGMRFEGSMYGLFVQGTINEPFPTQLGGCEVTLKDMYV